MFRKLTFLTVFFLFFSLAAFAQNAGTQKFLLFYYGVVTNVNDQNMLNITQDLFAAQIRGMDFVSMVDRRDDAVKKSYSGVLSDTDGSQFFELEKAASPVQEPCIVFYVRIYRPQADEKWVCTFFAKNRDGDTAASKSRQYDSYYKILSDAKAFIQEVVAAAAGIDGADSYGARKSGAESVAEKTLNTESIAGTWSGEEGVSKITLMRGGRGFIVFSNGAVMNAKIILVTEGSVQKLRVIQQDKFNASYYPDIERKIILSYAEAASPIEWNLTMTPQGTLKGTKTTLAASGGSVVPVSVDIVWTRR